jgi:NADPH-dependent ferric siderophore reductase
VSFVERIRGAAARTLGRAARVLEIRSISPHVVRLRVQGAAVRRLVFAPGDKIKLHVGDGQLRSFTPTAVDPSAGVFEIVVHVHGDSPTARWLAARQADDEVRFLGPASSVQGPRAPLPWAAFYGDETTIGLAEALAAALADGTPWLGAIETRPEDAIAVAHLSLRSVVRTESHGPGLVAHLQGATLPPGPGVVWLSGEASSVLALRESALARGIPRDRLCIKPYWSLAGTAHRKRLERTTLRA